MLVGNVKKLVYNHHDDVDGWQLDDGTFIHFPPHIGHELGEWIGEGDEVSVVGESFQNRNGETVLYPTYIESQGWSLTFEQKGHRSAKPGQERPARRHEERSHVTNEDIMHELLSIKKLIEAWDE